MVFAATFFTELFILFLLSKFVTSKLSQLFYRVTRSQTITINLLAFLFFPGTALHELAHFLMAALLFVPVGHMEFWPKIEGNTVKLGSVAVGQTDIFRRFLIGTAPFLFGTTLLIGMLLYAASNNLFNNTLFILLLGYASFEIGNTMFSSKKDMEGALELLGGLLFIGIVLYFLGVRLPVLNLESFFANPIVLQVFQQGSLFLLIPLGIDILLLIFLKIFLRR